MPLSEQSAREVEEGGFEKVTEEEIISLWRCFRSGGLSWEEAWHAIVVGIALDVAFARTQSLKQLEH